MDGVLKVELGSDLHIRVPCLYEVFFGEIEGLETATAAVFIKCQKGIDPIYNEGLD